MLPDALKENPVALAVQEFEAAALVDGKLDRGELTLEIAPERVVDICRLLKDRQGFVRLSRGARGQPLSGVCNSASR